MWHRSSVPGWFMRILFDNGTPRQLRVRLFGHVVEEARERGWGRLANGDLIYSADQDSLASDRGD